MKCNCRVLQWLAPLALLSTLNSQLSTLHAQGTTAFAYQGQLRDNGTNANGNYTMIFKLYDAAGGGDQVGSAVTNTTTLANGLFTVNLDFGTGAFDGSARWLDVTVKSGSYAETLEPRVQVLASPYAQFATIAATVTNSAIKNVNMAENAVATTNIQNAAITTAQIADRAVTNQNLAPNAVATANIQDYAVKNEKLAQNAVATLNIQNNAVTDAKIASVSGGKVTGSVASAVNASSFTGNLAGDVIGTQGATVVTSLSGNPTISGNPLFTGNLRLQKGVSGTTTWSASVGHANGPAGYSLDDALIFADEGANCLVLSPLAVWAPVGLGAYEIDCGEMNVRNPSSWATVASIDSGGNYEAAGWIIVSGQVTASSFNTSSDRNLKEQFTPIEGKAVLERVVNLPISSWNFKADPATRHLGPMAQDFYAAFNVGQDDKHIATVDEGGVALAAIQGLNQKLEAETKAKDEKINELERRLADLETLVKESTLK